LSNMSPGEIVRYVESSSNSVVRSEITDSRHPTNNRELVALANIACARSYFSNASLNKYRIARLAFVAFKISPTYTCKTVSYSLHMRVTRMIGCIKRGNYEEK
jgi:hypothetical protein